MPGPNPREDPRAQLYQDLHHGQISEEEAANRASARFILPLLFEHYRPASILDVGCGIGTWLDVARELGVADILGVDGDWLDRKLVRVPQDRVRNLDLEAGFDLGRRFDLVMNIEVAEHLSAAAADGFVASLVRHADVVLFSAAIPFQGGHHHVNEQFPAYWIAKFARHGYVPLDFLRPQLWDKDEILLWLRQNLLVFAKRPLTEAGGAFAGIPAGNGMHSLVHPDVYLARIESVQATLEEHRKLLELLESGKAVSAVRNPDGTLSVRVAD
jgi:SAM-dependent methyltransferase